MNDCKPLPVRGVGRLLDEDGVELRVGDVRADLEDDGGGDVVLVVAAHIGIESNVSKRFVTI